LPAAADRDFLESFAMRTKMLIGGAFVAGEGAPEAFARLE
jgi:hypothetical protein